MPGTPFLPETATLAEREAHATFWLLHELLPIIRRGLTVHDEGWNVMVDSAAKIAGAGDGPDAQYIREMLGSMRAQ